MSETMEQILQMDWVEGWKVDIFSQRKGLHFDLLFNKEIPVLLIRRSHIQEGLLHFINPVQSTWNDLFGHYMNSLIYIYIWDELLSHFQVDWKGFMFWFLKGPICSVYLMISSFWSLACKLKTSKVEYILKISGP